MAAATVFHIGGVVALGEVAVEIDRILVKPETVEFAPDDIDRKPARVRPVVGHIPARRGNDGDQPRPEIGMGQRDIPGSIAAGRVSGKEDAVGVNRKASQGLPQGCEHDRMFARRILIGCLMLSGPGGRDDDRAIPRGLTVPDAVGAWHSSPPFDLVQRARPGCVQRHNGRVAAQRVVLRRKLHEAANGLPCRACDLEFIEASRSCRRGINRRPHACGQRGKSWHGESFLLSHPRDEAGPNRLGRRVGVIADEIAKPQGGEGQLEVALANCRALEPATDGNGQRSVRRKIGVVTNSLERRESVEGAKRKLALDLVNGRGGLAGHIWLESPNAVAERRHNGRGTFPTQAVRIPSLADFLEQFAIGVVNGKRLEERLHELVLAHRCPGQNLVEQLSSSQATESLSLGRKIGELRKRFEHAIECLPRVVKPLSLHEQSHDPQAVVRARRIDLLGDHPLEDISRNRRCGEPHVDLKWLFGLHALHASPTRRDLGDALDDVEFSRGGGQREDSSAVFVERRGAQNGPYPADHAAVFRDPLGNSYPLHAGVDDRLCHGSDLSLGDHNAGELVIAHEDRFARRCCPVGCLERINCHPRQTGKAAIQDAAIKEFDPVSPGKHGATAGHEQDAPRTRPPHPADRLPRTVEHWSNLLGNPECSGLCRKPNNRAFDRVFQLAEDKGFHEATPGPEYSHRRCGMIEANRDWNNTRPQRKRGWVGLLVVLAAVAVPRDAAAIFEKDGYPWNVTLRSFQDQENQQWLLNLGPTGIRARIYPEQPNLLVVKHVFQDAQSPAKGKVNIDDVIVGANGRKFSTAHRFGRGARLPGGGGWDGPLMELAAAIEDSQGSTDGMLQLIVWPKANASQEKVVGVPLRKVGRFAPTFPYDCPRSKRMLTELCDFLVADYMSSDWKKPMAFGGMSYGRGHSMLALMASGNPKYEPLIMREMSGYAGRRFDPEGGGFQTWVWGFDGIVLGEYYLLTKDSRVVPAIQSLAEVMPQGSADGNGIYTHRSFPAIIRSGKKPYASIAAISGLNMVAMTLFKKAGLPYDKDLYQKIHQHYLNSTSLTSVDIAYAFKDANHINPPAIHPTHAVINLKDPSKGLSGRGPGYKCPTGMKGIGAFDIIWPTKEDPRWKPTDWIAAEAATNSLSEMSEPGFRTVFRNHPQYRQMPEPTQPFQTSRSGGHLAPVGMGAIAHLISNEDKPSWQYLGRHAANTCVLGPGNAFDGHAASNLHAFWSILGAARSDNPAALQAYFNYMKTFLILSETHNGGLVLQPWGRDRANCNSDVSYGPRTLTTASGAILLALGERRLQITGADRPSPGKAKVAATRGKKNKPPVDEPKEPNSPEATAVMDEPDAPPEPNTTAALPDEREPEPVLKLPPLPPFPPLPANPEDDSFLDSVIREELGEGVGAGRVSWNGSEPPDDK